MKSTLQLSCWKPSFFALELSKSSCLLRGKIGIGYIWARIGAKPAQLGSVCVWYPFFTENSGQHFVWLCGESLVFFLFFFLFFFSFFFFFFFFFLFFLFFCSLFCCSLFCCSLFLFFYSFCFSFFLFSFFRFVYSYWSFSIVSAQTLSLS